MKFRCKLVILRGFASRLAAQEMKIRKEIMTISSVWVDVKLIWIMIILDKIESQHANIDIALSEDDTVVGLRINAV